MDARLKPLAARSRKLQGEATIEMCAKALEMERQGLDIVRMEIGDPDFCTPDHITHAAVASLQAGETHYEASGGSAALREAAAAYLRRTRPGLRADAANVLCMPGAKPIIHNTILTLCEEGDEVIIPDPGFSTYATTVEWAGAVAVPLRLQEASGFSFSHAELRRVVSARTKLIIICSPGVLSAADLDCVAAVAKACGAWVLSDEIYSALIYDGDGHPDTIATREGMLERTIVLDGCSKGFAMTGWRVGFGLFPAALVEASRNIGINSWTCLPPFVSAGAIAALTGPPMLAMKAEFEARRNLVFDAINSVPGLRIAVRPAGAIYILVNITGTGLTTRVFVERLLEEHGVVLLDATMYGACGQGFVRIALGQSQERLTEGCTRIAKFVASLGIVSSSL